MLFYFGSCDNRRQLPPLQKVPDASSWRQILAPDAGREFAGVWGRGANEIWAYGKKIYRYDGRSWSDVSSQFGAFLPATSVHGAETGPVYVLSRRSRLARFRDGKVDELELPIYASDVFVTAGGTLYLLGVEPKKEGMALAYGQPGAWKIFRPGPKLSALAPVGKDRDVWFVSTSYGWGTFLHHHDGTSWSTEKIGMWTAFGLCYLGAGRPLIYVHSVDHYPRVRLGSGLFGSKFERWLTPGMEDAKLAALHCNGPDHIWAYGGIESQLSIFRFRRDRWLALETGFDLIAARIYGLPTGFAVVVRGDGALYMRKPD